jgi:hypothetical protein
MQSEIFATSNLTLIFASSGPAGMSKSPVSGISELLVCSTRLKGFLRHQRWWWWKSWKKANSLI